MAALDLQEQEQVAELKAWWNRYGTHVLTAVTAVFLVIAGINGWNYYQRTQSGASAQVFEGLQKLASGGDAPKVLAAAKALSDQYPRTSFASLGQLLAARIAFDANDLTGARGALQWVTDNARDDELRHVARVRLAGVMADQKEFDAALKLLDAERPAHFEAVYSDRRGDILYAQGKPAEAKTAWEKAQGAATGALRSAIDFKLELVGGQPVPTKS